MASDKIEAYTKGYDIDKFISDPKTVDAVVRNLEIIGEASKLIPDTIKTNYPKIPWNLIVGLRNRIAHEYFGIDEYIIWEIIDKDISKLKSEIKYILEIITE